MQLTSENVQKTFFKCLFAEGEPTTNYVLAEGVRMNIGFHPERLEKEKEHIIEMLNELPNDFKKTGGGGMSVLNMVIDKDGNQWADLHQTMDQLICLGIAVKKLSFLLPRDHWEHFPGGMPYVLVDC